MAEPGPLAAFRRYLGALPKQDRAWLAICCMLRTDDRVHEGYADGDGTVWFETYLAVENGKPRLVCGRLIQIVALIDFTLSEWTTATFAADAAGMAQSNEPFIARQGTDQLREGVPRRRRMADAWKDVRSHELDVASLQEYYTATIR